MELDERVILTGFGGSVTAKDSGNPKLQADPIESTFAHNADGNPNFDESHQRYDEKLKRKQSQENVFPENIRIYRTDEPEDKDVFLPRLTGSSHRTSPENRQHDGKVQQVRLPEIRIVPRKISMLALNRSITDLLDPEMEILNKIKHGPRKKKRKHRNKTVQLSEHTGP